MRKQTELSKTWIFKYIGAAILILVPLYPKFPLFDVSGTFVSIRFEDILLALAGILVIVTSVSNWKDILRDRLLASIFLFFVVGLTSLLSGAYLTQTVVPKIGFLHWLRRIEYVIPLFLGLEIVKRKIRIDFYLKILLLVIFLCFLYGFGQKNFGWPIIITQNEEYSKGIALRWISGSHINSTFAGHYDLSTFLVLSLPIIVSSFFLLKGKITKLILGSAYFSGMWLLVNSASRISLFSYLLSTLIALVLIRKYKEMVLIILISLIFVGFSSNLLDRYSRLFEVVKSNLQSNHQFVPSVFATDGGSLRKMDVTSTPTPVPAPLEDRSTNIRLNVEWPRALRAFYKNPLLGTGYSSITLATDNDYLRALGETGILGLLAFLLIIFGIINKFLSVLPLDKNFSGLNLAFMAGLLGSLPGLLVNAVFIDIFEASKFALIFWFFIGLALKLSHEKS